MSNFIDQTILETSGSVRDTSVKQEALDTASGFLQRKFGRPLDDQPFEVKSIFNTMSKYVSTMREGVGVTTPVMVAQQQALFLALQQSVNCKPEVSIIAITLILHIMHGYRDCLFNDRLVYRAVKDMTITPQQFRFFRSLLHLYMATSDPGLRRTHARRVSLETVLSFVPSDTAKENIRRFYSINTM